MKQKSLPEGNLRFNWIWENSGIEMGVESEFLYGLKEEEVKGDQKKKKKTRKGARDFGEWERILV